MARRPVVIQGPPKGQPRTPIVVRDGPPPRDRRSIMDISMGALGAALLILAVALFGILPEDPAPPRLFDVTYTETVTEDGQVQSLFLNEEQTTRFAVPIDVTNVHSIQFTVEFADDVPSSRPDTFAFQIFGPDSEPAMDEIRFDTPTPQSDDNPVAPQFTTSTTRQIITAQIAPPPQDGPQAPLSNDEDFPNARARIMDETNTRPAGDWILDIYLAQTGDCPAPTDPEGPAHALACETATGQEGDPGNPVQIVKVTFTTYDAIVVE